ncbi:MAG: hypothetical protein ACI8XO_000442, partial [Verrucomicrobiales bacterium]
FLYLGGEFFLLGCEFLAVFFAEDGLLVGTKKEPAGGESGGNEDDEDRLWAFHNGVPLI